MAGTGLVQLPLCVSDLDLGAVTVLDQRRLLSLQSAQLLGQGSPIRLGLVALQVLPYKFEVVTDHRGLLELRLEVGQFGRGDLRRLLCPVSLESSLSMASVGCVDCLGGLTEDARQIATVLVTGLDGLAGGRLVLGGLFM